MRKMIFALFVVMFSVGLSIRSFDSGPPDVTNIKHSNEVNYSGNLEIGGRTTSDVGVMTARAVVSHQYGYDMAMLATDHRNFWIFTPNKAIRAEDSQMRSTASYNMGMMTSTGTGHVGRTSYSDSAIGKRLTT